MTPFTHTDGRSGNWLAPTTLARQRLLERAGAHGRPMLVNGLLVVLVLALTAIFRDAWALLPLGVLLVTIAAGPVALRGGARPEYLELGFGLAVTIAMAVGAGLTGGAASPIAYLLALGVVMNALRAGAVSIVVSSLVTAVAFLASSLLAGVAVSAEPLPTLAVLVSLLAVTVASVALAEAEIGFRTSSIVDPLTGLLNRQALEARFEELRQQALLSDSSVCLVLFDLDHFKRVNDEHGHSVGDRLLRDIAYEVRKSLRRFELVYRIGGEEFLAVLPGLGEEEGEATAHHLRAVVERVRLHPDIGVTASFGVSVARGEEIDFAALFGHADAALYRAKREGRDRVGTSAGPIDVAAPVSA